jgi:adenylyl cyclase-associated protein
MDESEASVIVERIELTPIIRRLEAATSRLEDMASAITEAPKTNGAMPPVSTAAGVAAVASEPAAPKKVVEPLPQMIEDFDTFIETAVKKYVNLSNELGGPVAEQVWTIREIIFYN